MPWGRRSTGPLSEPVTKNAHGVWQCVLMLRCQHSLFRESPHLDRYFQTREMMGIHLYPGVSMHHDNLHIFIQGVSHALHGTILRAEFAPPSLGFWSCISRGSSPVLGTVLVYV
jgi:hypothetical protein